MRPESRKLLHDVLGSSEAVASFTRGKSFEDYKSDDLLRSAVERQLEIAGEALNQLQKQDPDTASRIPGIRKVIDFRNILAHGYAALDDRVVWDIVLTHVPPLRHRVDDLLHVD